MLYTTVYYPAAYLKRYEDVASYILDKAQNTMPSFSAFLI